MSSNKSRLTLITGLLDVTQILISKAPKYNKKYLLYRESTGNFVNIMNHCCLCNRKVYEDDYNRLTAEGKTYIVCLPCVNDYEGLKSIRADLKKQIDELENRIHNYTGTRTGENCENVIGIKVPLEHKLVILKEEYETIDHITELARVVAYWKKEAENDPDFDPYAPFE